MSADKYVCVCVSYASRCLNLYVCAYEEFYAVMLAISKCVDFQAN